MIRVITLALALLFGALSNARPPALAQTPEDEAAPAPDFFIEAEVDNRSPYVGQQVTYTLRRYQAAEFPNPPHYQEHPFTGFIDTPLLQRPGYTATVGDRSYKVHPTHIALFPTLAGPVTIEPARLIIPGNGPKADTIIQSESLQLNVQRLPENPPVDFKGAVGQFSISAHFTPPEGEVNQPLTLVVQIEGSGNIATLPEPIIPTMDNWRLLGAAQSQTNVSLSKDLVTGWRRFEWPLSPLQGGQQYFPAINFSYFDPQSETYQNIRTNPISVVIYPLPEDNVPPPPPPAPSAQQAVRRLASDIRHIKPAPAALSTTVTTPTPTSPWVWGCALLPLLAVGGAWYFQGWRNPDTPAARRRQARRRAKKALASARQSDANSYAAIHAALAHYLADRLGQSTTGLTTDQLAGRLLAAGLPPQLIERVRSLLTRAEASRFAPATAESSPRSLLAAAQVLIDDLEIFFSKQSPPTPS